MFLIPSTNHRFWISECEEACDVEIDSMIVEVEDCGEVPCMGWVEGAGVEEEVVGTGGVEGDGCGCWGEGKSEEGERVGGAVQLVESLLDVVVEGVGTL